MMTWYPRIRKAEVDSLAQSCRRFAGGLAVKAFVVVSVCVMACVGGLPQFLRVSAVLALLVFVFYWYGRFLVQFAVGIHELEVRQVLHAAKVMRIMAFVGVDFPRGLSCAKKIREIAVPPAEPQGQTLVIRSQ